MRLPLAFAVVSIAWTAVSWICSYAGAREAALGEAGMALVFGILAVVALAADRRSTRP
jgi:hypothetical protein